MAEVIGYMLMAAKTRTQPGILNEKPGQDLETAQAAE